MNHHERAESGIGTQKMRLGGGSLKDVDACALCLHTVVSPLACPSGHLYCKKCIHEALLEQAKEIKRVSEQWEIQNVKKAEESERKEQKERDRQLMEFEKTELGVGGKEVDVFEKDERTHELEDDRRKDVGTFYREAKHFHTKSDERSQMSSSSTKGSIGVETAQEATEMMRNDPKDPKNLRAFWLPSLTPSAEKDEVKKPKFQTVCPSTGHPLKLRKLIECKFTVNSQYEDAEDNPQKSNIVRYMCPVCLKGITNSSRVVLMKNCGHVMCKGCTDKFCKSECNVCGKEIRKQKEKIELERGGTGYAGGVGEKLHAVKQNDAVGF